MTTKSENKAKQKIFVGIDVATRSWAVSIVSAEGELIERMSLQADFEILKKVLRKYDDSEISSVYEAGRWGFHLHRQLQQIGVENIITPPNKIPTLTGDLVKTDRRDSLKLAQFLAKGLLKAIFVPSEEQVNARQLLRAREQVKRKRIRSICQIKSLLAQYGVVFPVSGGAWSKTKARIVESLELPSKVQLSLRLLIREIEFLDNQLSTLVQELRQLMKQEPYQHIYERLRSVPGVGELTASALALEIADLSRFSNAKKLCAFLGLTPREYSSGEFVFKGRITGQGSDLLRAFMIEAAWRAKREDPLLEEKYKQLKLQTGSGKKAIVALARKLVTKIFYMLKKRLKTIKSISALPPSHQDLLEGMRSIDVFYKLV